MNTIGFSASPRGEKSWTLRLVRKVLDGAEADGAATELINIFARSIGFCTACKACNETGRCVIDDDFNETLAILRTADGVVLGSPVYIDDVSAQMNAFADRLNDTVHYQLLTGKYGYSVATTWGSGGREVIAYLDHILQYLGAQTIPGLSVTMGVDENALVTALPAAWELGHSLTDVIQDRPVFPDQQEFIRGNREAFAAIVVANRNTRPVDYQAWVDRG